MTQKNPKLNKYDKFILEALDKMFISVGFDGFDEDFVKQEKWYLLRTWTKEKEDEYKDWFINAYRTKFRKSRAAAEFEARYFLFMWGWKYENN